MGHCGASVLLPDRDNTFAAYKYCADGKIAVDPSLTLDQIRMATACLSLVGLDKAIEETFDANDKLVALDRMAQRMEAWAIAENARIDITANSGNEALRTLAAKTACQSGFFSVWMTVFRDDAAMKNRLIDAFPGTRASGCFAPGSADSIAPAPNPDGLPHGGKI